MTQQTQEPMGTEGTETGRLEAFSDGVIAIAITLLVLDLKAPETPGVSLAAALGQQWPTFLAYVTSFAFIGIMWINHHRLFTQIGRTDNNLLLLNLALLLAVTFLPFPTGLVARNLLPVSWPPAADQQVAGAVYNGTFVVIALVFNLLWRYAAHDHRLLDRQADQAAVDRISRQYAVGPLFYLAVFVVGLLSLLASVVLSLLLAIYFALPGPPRRPRRR